MKLGRDGVTQLQDDEEDKTVAPVAAPEGESEDDKAARLAAEAEGETEEDKAARLEAEATAAAAAESELVVTIGEGTPPSEEDDAEAPAWVKQLRKDHRELTKRNRELEAERAARESGNQPAAIVVGEKPTLEGHDYDSEKFATALESWHERKRKADDTVAEQKKQDDVAKAAWQATLNTYGEAKAKLKVKDADDAEATAQEILSTTQQGVILAGAENPALLIYALGKNPKKAKELASIKDPVKFAFAVAKLETQVKATPRKAPPPETVPSGSAPKTGIVDSQLEKLRKEAETTSDYSKVTAYKRQKRLNAAA